MPSTLGARARVAQRRARRFLHHVAERAGELQLAASGDDADFDLEHFATDARVRESRRDADFVIEREQRRIVWREPSKSCRSAARTLSSSVARVRSALR